MLIRGLGLRIGLATGSALAALAMAPAAQAQSQDARRAYDLARQDLGTSLRAVALTSGRNIIAAADLLKGKMAPPLRGTFSAEEAVERLLSGTGLHLRKVGSDLIVERDGEPPREVFAAEPSGGGIVVTGSRIRGAPVVASTTISLDRQSMRNEAVADLGQLVREIPQSFGGGQNPGIGATVPTTRGGDVGGGSSLNLRGLGSDATLTLLNGHRLAYTAALQSVDVSAIPLAAVERIEIVPDGASAIYGSDAVAGVANIIMRRDYSGLEAGARLAATSDGGDFQQRYDALAGGTWSSGGIMAAYEYGSNTAIRASERSYAAERSPGLDLYPALRHHSVLASGHQDLGKGLSFSMDGLYNIRWSDLTIPTLAGGDLNAGRASTYSVDKSYGVAPTIALDLPATWQVALTGTYGKERVEFHQIQCAGAACDDSGLNFYSNTAKSLELTGTGDLATLPGGVARLAVGGGYREIGFHRFSAALSAVNTAHRQSSYFFYGEANLPLIGAAQELPFVERFDIDAAVRYERYPGIGGVLTPKIGAVWALTPDVALKGSWGRSYRAPTLFQQYQPRTAALYPPALLGAASAPSGASAILLVGGSPDLKPERATTWSATLDLHPRALPGATLDVSYFDIDYRDRIVSPIGLLSQALGDPLYQMQVTRDPSAAAQAAATASASTFTNFTGVPYDPANVIAIVDNAYVNAGHQRARGIDILARYALTLGDHQKLTVSANVTYLESHQQLTSTQPQLPLAGTIYNPPHWRGRGAASWSGGPLTLTADVSYLGGVRDTRFTPSTPIGGMTPVDVSARYRIDAPGSPIEGLEFTLSVQNLFNDKPEPITVRAPYETPYDSTNYSPIGRLLAIEVRKKW